MFEEYDVVELLKPTPVQWEGEELLLAQGLTGTVLGSNKESNSYLVEFADEHGETIAMAPITTTSLKLLWQSRSKSYVNRQTKGSVSI